MNTEDVVLVAMVRGFTRQSVKTIGSLKTLLRCPICWK